MYYSRIHSRMMIWISDRHLLLFCALGSRRIWISCISFPELAPQFSLSFRGEESEPRAHKTVAATVLIIMLNIWEIRSHAAHLGESGVMPDTIIYKITWPSQVSRHCLQHFWVLKLLWQKGHRKQLVTLPFIAEKWLFILFLITFLQLCSNAVISGVPPERVL